MSQNRRSLKRVYSTNLPEIIVVLNISPFIRSLFSISVSPNIIEDILRRRKKSQRNICRCITITKCDSKNIFSRFRRTNSFNHTTRFIHCKEGRKIRNSNTLYNSLVRRSETKNLSRITSIRGNNIAYIIGSSLHTSAFNLTEYWISLCSTGATQCTFTIEFWITRKRNTESRLCIFPSLSSTILFKYTKEDVEDSRTTEISS